MHREPQAFDRAMAELIGWYAQDKVVPSIDRRLPMSALPEAYARMASRQVCGKLLLMAPP